MPDLNTSTKPTAGFSFLVQWADLAGGGLNTVQFSKVSGLEDESDVIEYREGSDPYTPRKYPGQIKFPRLVLEHGTAEDNSLLVWRQQVIQMGAPTLGGGAGTNASLTDSFRKTLTICLYDYNADDGADFVRKWVVRNAWPAKLSYGDLDASSSEILIESIELEHEGLISFGPDVALGAIKAAVPNII